MFATPAHLAQALTQWPFRSQEGARRNALVACTALAEKSRERVEVEEFLAHHAALRAAGPTTLEVGVRTARSAG